MTSGFDTIFINETYKKLAELKILLTKCMKLRIYKDRIFLETFLSQIQADHL